MTIRSPEIYSSSNRSRKYESHLLGWINPCSTPFIIAQSGSCTWVQSLNWHWATNARISGKYPSSSSGSISHSARAFNPGVSATYPPPSKGKSSDETVVVQPSQIPQASLTLWLVHILGADQHSKPSTTLDIYGHLIPVMQDGVAILMDELVTPIPVEMGESVSSDKLSGNT